MNAIYKATNLLNGKPYIGFDSSWPNRQKEHLRESFQPNRQTYYTDFHKAIRDSGPASFTWEILYTSEDAHHTLNVMEPKFILEHNSHYIYGHGYNMTFGGEGCLGRKHKPETKELLSSKGRIRFSDPKLREAYSLRMKGVASSPEWREKNSSRMKLICNSTEYRASLSERAKVLHGTLEWRTAQSQKMRDKQNVLGHKYARVTCPWCNRSGGGGSMTRRHFDNCKMRPHE